MTTLREAAQFALDALHCPGDSELMDRVEQKLRAALAEQPAEQEPVAHVNSNGVVHAAGYPWSDKEVLRPLVYGDTSQKPVKREPLTDEDIQDLLKVGNPTEDEYRLIRMGWNAAHGIGGQP